MDLPTKETELPIVGTLAALQAKRDYFPKEFGNLAEAAHQPEITQET